MKGRYAGRRMTVYGTILPGAVSIARSAALADILTEQAKHKIKIMDWYRVHNQNAALTARHFGIGRATFHRWLRRYRQQGLVGLNEYSRKPKRLRKPTTSPEVAMRIVQLRKQFSAWSKYKLRALLTREGINISASTIGRILKRRGFIDLRIARKRKKAAKHPRIRFQRGLKIAQPGDLIQMDTKHIMLPGGRRFYQFTAIDVLTKQRILRVYSSESSRNGAHFLNECASHFPFPMKAIQTDNGAPFLKEFEKRCRELNFTHYFIYPRNPKQNSYVEISHEADVREFYQFGNVTPLLEAMQTKIKFWENIWNTVRPHESLNQLTPQEYYQKWQRGRLPTKDVITLQT